MIDLDINRLIATDISFMYQDIVGIVSQFLTFLMHWILQLRLRLLFEVTSVEHGFRIGKERRYEEP